MQPVNSSNIASIGYDPDNKKLTVEFRNGSMYEYENVPEDEYQELMGAGSIGSYFASNIKNSFTYRRV